MTAGKEMGRSRREAEGEGRGKRKKENRGRGKGRESVIQVFEKSWTLQSCLGLRGIANSEIALNKAD